MAEKSMLEQILKAETGRNMAIAIHDNPDLDSIGSAESLKKIAEHFGVYSEIVYSGEITNIENKALVNQLGIELIEFKKAEVSKYSLFAIVDALPGNSNVSIDIKKPAIIIDHHDKRYEGAPEQYVRIEKAGACSSILIAIIKELGIELVREQDQHMIQLCFEGIKQDTSGFVFGMTDLDIMAMSYLIKKIDENQYKKIRSELITDKQAQIMARAILSKTFDHGYAVAPVGIINEKEFDSLHYAASSLLRIERIDTAIVYGLLCGEKTVLAASIRNIEPSRNAAEIAKKIFGDEDAGGSKEKAGARVKTADYLKSLETEKIWEVYHKETANRIRDLFGIDIK